MTDVGLLLYYTVCVCALDTLIFFTFDWDSEVAFSTVGFAHGPNFFVNFLMFQGFLRASDTGPASSGQVAYV